MKKAFIFDFDGTLGETIPLVLESVNLAFADCGINAPSFDAIKANFGPDEYGLLLKMYPSAADKLYPAYLRHYKNLHKKFSPKPFDGIQKLLSTLKTNGSKIGIVTGKGRDSLDISLDVYDIRGFFDIVKSGDKRGAIKPQRIAEILDVWKISPSEVYYVGDAATDVTDSRKAGIIPLSARWSKHAASLEQLKELGQQNIFETVAELIDFL